MKLKQLKALFRVKRRLKLLRQSSDEEPFSALAFKIATDPFVGTLTFIRVYSGVVSVGDSVINSTKGKKERIGRMVRCIQIIEMS